MKLRLQYFGHLMQMTDSLEKSLILGKIDGRRKRGHRRMRRLDDITDATDVNLGKLWVPSLSWEDPLEKGKATQSSILAWRIPWTA